jgi:Ni2+-binding GTPase involved in maturation of urease and hydrogenase
MSLDNLFSDKKTVTVSGLYSGVGKTLLAEYITSMVNDIAAIKITINDFFTLVTDDEKSIMVEGKDTFRLKSRGAKKVVWVRSKEEDIEEAVQQALYLINDCKKILVEGNSILNYMTPDLAIFVCDEKLSNINKLKPSRLTALKKADIIINNIRDDSATNRSAVEKVCKKVNKKIPFISLNLKDGAAVLQTLKDILSQRGF